MPRPVIQRTELPDGIRFELPPLSVWRGGRNPLLIALGSAIIAVFFLVVVLNQGLGQAPPPTAN